MTVHPQIAALLAALQDARLPPIETLSPAEAREQMDAMVQARGGAAAPVARVAERSIQSLDHELPLRIYWPKADERKFGVVLYFHGGGHVIGNLDTHDRIARNLAAGARAIVVSVDYRLAPEHKFPAAVDDAWTALSWLGAHAEELGGDPGRLAVAGDSAGANLATVVALMARDAGGPALRMQSLIYPVSDYRLVGDSYAKFGHGYGVLTAAAMQWFKSHYLSHRDEGEDWRASPILADRLEGVAPAVIIAAECDVLHDEGVRYAKALKAAGVPVYYRRYDGMIHGFFGMAPEVDAAVAAQAHVCDTLRAALALEADARTDC